MVSLFKKKSVDIHSPANGKLININEVNDPVFSQGMMGPGFAIIPEKNDIFSPISGKVTSVFPTKHAIGLESKGIKFLIHIGIDTVELNGQGFEIHVQEGDRVTPDTLLVKIDRKFLASQEKEDTIMVVLPEYDKPINVTESYVDSHDAVFEIN